MLLKWRSRGRLVSGPATGFTALRDALMRSRRQVFPPVHLQTCHLGARRVMNIQQSVFCLLLCSKDQCVPLCMWTPSNLSVTVTSQRAGQKKPEHWTNVSRTLFYKVEKWRQRPTEIMIEVIGRHMTEFVDVSCWRGWGPFADQGPDMPSQRSANIRAVCEHPSWCCVSTQLALVGPCRQLFGRLSK